MSSSSKKKRHLIQKCRFCDCFFLTKDIDEHRIGRQTPNARPTEAEQIRCDTSDFELCRFALIRPHFGLALRQHNKSQTNGNECPLPVTLCGWVRHNLALVHPETLNIAGLRPRSAVLFLSPNGKSTDKLLSLWPSAEVPPMRILLPFHDDSLLVRLAILPASSVLISKMFLQPNLSASELPLELWPNLAQLSHFPLFIRSFFCDAFVCEHFNELEFFYYGQRIIFRITDMEFANESEGKTKGEKKKTDEKGQVADGGRQNAKTHRISPLCAFDIHWNEVRENARREEDDDPENLC
ncbi:hypothetical protein niasHT_010030 [Heterodera trifolii]|uniref:Uncharacterized protein n=1 Tax=Heterodera trifolii TaxID=157864 RepID=A0ABD2M8H7_9BILA